MKRSCIATTHFMWSFTAHAVVMDFIAFNSLHKCLKFISRFIVHVTFSRAGQVRNCGLTKKIAELRTLAA